MLNPLCPPIGVPTAQIAQLQGDLEGGQGTGTGMQWGKQLDYENINMNYSSTNI